MIANLTEYRKAEEEIRALEERLKKLQKEHSAIQEVRGLGLMIGMELDSTDFAKSIVKQMLERGVILNRTDETVVRFLPPYLITRKHVDVVMGHLKQVFTSSTLAPVLSPVQGEGK